MREYRGVFYVKVEHVRLQDKAMPDPSYDEVAAEAPAEPEPERPPPPQEKPVDLEALRQGITDDIAAIRDALKDDVEAANRLGPLCKGVYGSPKQLNAYRVEDDPEKLKEFAELVTALRFSDDKTALF